MSSFVLVAGAWQGGWAWDRVAPRLRARGHDVHTPTLTGLGERAHLLSPQTGLDTHTDDLVGLLVNQQLSDVILVGHSYGGQVIAATATRRPDLIGRLIYLDAFLPDDGQSATQEQPAQIAEHYRESVEAHGFGWLIPPRRLEVLGVTEPDDVSWLQSLMVPHPYRSFNDPASVSTESLQVPAAYVECTDWMRVFQAQRKKAESRGWPVSELATGHQAMTTAPEQLTDLLDNQAKEDRSDG